MPVPLGNCDTLARLGESFLIRLIRLASFAILVIFVLLTPARLFPQTVQNPAHLEVDLREAPRHIFHAKLTLPARSGPLTLVYPKWIPGEHSPIGPIVDLVGLKVSAGG